jgi:two-component system chemotaxis response regulator CheY
VEDDFVLRCSLAELLSEEAFRVECCADGDEALRRLQRPPPPALILLDIMLPRINGFELRALQRKNPMTADIPVIAISAHDLDPQHVDELDLGPTFRKPLDIDRLLTRIRSLTGHA